MKIGIIGAGMIGATAARLFVAAGHEVAVSNSRGPGSLRDLVAGLGSQAHAMTVAEAARWGEVVLLAVPWRSPEALPPAEAVSGKIVIDAMNPYGADGQPMDLAPSTSSEQTRARLPGARLVKAFNTIYFEHLAERVVINLIDDIGFGAVDTGSLVDGGRRQQPGAPIYNRPMTVREARQAL
jgi:predicted dinucleotide-binding enzyme